MLNFNENSSNYHLMRELANIVNITVKIANFSSYHKHVFSIRQRKYYLIITFSNLQVETQDTRKHSSSLSGF